MANNEGKKKDWKKVGVPVICGIAGIVVGAGAITAYNVYQAKKNAESSADTDCCGGDGSSASSALCAGLFGHH